MWRSRDAERGRVSKICLDRNLDIVFEYHTTIVCWLHAYWRKRQGKDFEVRPFSQISDLSDLDLGTGDGMLSCSIVLYSNFVQIRKTLWTDGCTNTDAWTDMETSFIRSNGRIGLDFAVFYVPANTVQVIWKTNGRSWPQYIANKSFKQRWLHLPVDDIKRVKIAKSRRNFSSIKSTPVFRERALFLQMEKQLKTKQNNIFPYDNDTTISMH